jgi:multicomponent Na+:H+ antiporter subunit A
MRVERSLILETSIGVLFHTTLLFSLFLLFAGHNAPGGGFIGGLVAGAAFVLRYVDAGAAAVERSARVGPHLLLGTGLALAVLTGAASWIAGEAFLEAGELKLDVPVIGLVKTTSALPFDIGVFLVVVGLVLMVLTSLGAESER